MLNHYPIWKNLIVIFIVVFGVIYSAPNLYPDDPVIQISGENAATEVTQEQIDAATKALKTANIDYFGDMIEGRTGIIRFSDTETQLAAKDVVQLALGTKYVAALNLAPTTPEWLSSMGAKPMNLGLDLRGGVHFLLEVDMDTAMKTRMDDYVASIKRELIAERVYYKRVTSDISGVVTVTFNNLESLNKADDIIRDGFREFQITTEEEGEPTIKLVLPELKIKEIEDLAIKQNLNTIRNRVNEIGVAEPLVQRQGRNRIVVELPGVQDTAIAKRIIGRTATLEFRLEDRVNDAVAAARGRVPAGSELFPFKNNERPPVLLEKDIIVKGESVIDAQASYDENGRPQVNIRLNSKGGSRMFKVTKDHVGDTMAVLFVEFKTRMVEKMVDGEKVIEPDTYADKYVINVATIQSALKSDFRITGLDSPLESSELALLLRSGALAAPMYFVEERTVGPSLGAENIESGFKSFILGIVLVMAFMLVYYRVFGLIANVALVVNTLVLVAIMSLLGATLTLPGIAGIVLTVGMAVDANVLIYARIKEELSNGVPPQQAINSGYERAFVTILDANITTLIVAIILFAAGTGAVKGFAVTLMIGITTSMFTAIMGTRAVVNLIYGGRQLTTLKV